MKRPTHKQVKSAYETLKANHYAEIDGLTFWRDEDSKEVRAKGGHIIHTDYLYLPKFFGYNEFFSLVLSWGESATVPQSWNETARRLHWKRNPEDGREGKRNPFFSDIDLTLDGIQFVFDELDRRLAENGYKINWNAQIKNNILKRLKESAKYANHLELNTATLQYLLKSVPQKNIIKDAMQKRNGMGFEIAKEWINDEKDNPEYKENPSVLGLSKKAFAEVKEQAEEIADAIARATKSYPVDTALSIVASQYKIPIALAQSIMMKDKRNNNKRAKKKPDLSRLIQNPAPMLVKVEWGNGDLWDVKNVSKGYKEMAQQIGLDFQRHCEIRFKRDQPFYDEGKYEVWVSPKFKEALEDEGLL